MPSTDEAIAAFRARVESGAFAFPIYFDGDDPYFLPDTPTVWGYAEFMGQGSGLVGWGGGRRNNLYRNSAIGNIWVFSPIGYGPEAATRHAKPVRDHMCGYRDEVISIFRADNIHLGQGSNLSIPGLISEVSNYQVALVECDVIYDEIG